MLNSNLSTLAGRFRLNRGLLFGGLIITALLAFEFFNYSTTDFALSDLLGELKFLGVRWATILSIAFCGIDFAGIARLFTPEQGRDEPAEVWYLFGAWMLAATMNAMLTWWGVSIAILNHQTLGNAVVARETLLQVVPIFVAIMVWLIRVLIIGTISVAGDHLFSQADSRARSSSSRSIGRSSNRTNARSNGRSQPAPLAAQSQRSSYSSSNQRSFAGRSYQSHNRPEPVYEPEAASQEPVYTPVSFNAGRSNNRETNRSDNRSMRF